MLLIITISTFVCISFGVMALYWLVYRPQSAATERLKQLGQTNSAATGAGVINEERPGAELAERIAAPLHPRPDDQGTQAAGALGAGRRSRPDGRVDRGRARVERRDDAHQRRIEGR